MGSGGISFSKEKMPGTLEGIISYHRGRGWEQDPSLEEKQESQLVSFVKPLPDGSRLHRRVFKGKKYFTIREHKDTSDPKRDPIGHVQDILIPPKHKIIRIKKT